MHELNNEIKSVLKSLSLAHYEDATSITIAIIKDFELLDYTLLGIKSNVENIYIYILIYNAPEFIPAPENKLLTALAIFLHDKNAQPINPDSQCVYVTMQVDNNSGIVLDMEEWTAETQEILDLYLSRHVH